MALDILIIDDENDIRDLIAGILEDEGYETRQAHDADSGLNEIARRRPSLVFLDIWMQGSRLDGLQLLDVLQTQHPDMPVVMISGHGNVETAVSAIRRGAYDYIEKPFKIDRLLLITQRAVEATRLRNEVAELKERGLSGGTDMVGTSPALQQIKAVIEKSAPTNSRIFISGASGTGKGMVARMIHQRSQRAQAPFVEINCSLYAPDEVPVVLFGRESREKTGLCAPKSAPWSVPMAARSTSLKWRRCRPRRRARSCARWSRASSIASAGRFPCRSTFASSLRARRTFRR